METAVPTRKYFHGALPLHYKLFAFWRDLHALALIFIRRSSTICFSVQLGSANLQYTAAT